MRQCSARGRSALVECSGGSGEHVQPDELIPRAVLNGSFRPAEHVLLLTEEDDLTLGADRLQGFEDSPGPLPVALNRDVVENERTYFLGLGESLGHRHPQKEIYLLSRT